METRKSCDEVEQCLRILRPIGGVKLCPIGEVILEAQNSRFRISAKNRCARSCSLIAASSTGSSARFESYFLPNPFGTLDVVPDFAAFFFASAASLRLSMTGVGFVWTGCQFKVSDPPTKSTDNAMGMTKEQESTATRAALNLLSAVLIAGCSATTDPGDTTSPTVTAVSPANASVGVLITSVVTITFSEPMSPATVSASSVTLTPTAGGVAIPGTVTYDLPTRTATFTPLKAFDYGTGYTLTVTRAASDVAGNAIAAEYVATFTAIQKVFDKPYFQGTNAITNSSQPQVHVHVRFTQNGQTLGRPADCERLPLANCDVLPRNAAGLVAIGALDDQGVAATITQVSGTFTDPTISFTFTLANGRTFIFTGTVSNSETMTGTLTGATLPPIQIVLSRIPAPEP
jgi:hypothetical protein